MKQNLLIWFRRFRPEYGQKFRFHTALHEACNSLAYPITIQDSSYRSSLLGSFFGRGWFILPLAFIVIIIGMVALIPIVLSIFPKESSLYGFVIGIILLVTLVIFIALKFYQRLGFKKIRGKSEIPEFVHQLISIKAGQRGIVMGIDVFQCDDAIWQDVVTAALMRADIAIIDLSELTENLTWEISKALNTLPQDRIIFVCEEDVFQEPELLSKLKQHFSSLVHDLNVEKMKDKIVVYPSKWAGVGPGRRRQVVEFAKKLRLEVAERVLHDE